MRVDAQPVAPPPATAQALLDVRDLRVSATTPEGPVQILAGISLRIAPGEALAVVGESGSGKSTTARAILGILAPTLRVDSGAVMFDRRDLLHLGRREMNRIRGRELTMIFQDPNTSLNPVYTIGDQMESVVLWQGRSRPRLRVAPSRRRAARDRILDALDRVRLPSPRSILDTYPFQLSGGMRQRVLIAMALVNEPKLIVADEPGSALDVTVQDQILELLEKLIVDRGLSLLFITHNLGIARRVTQRVAVMYSGEVVETADTQRLFDKPLHPYTQGLLASVPKLSGVRAKGIAGRLPDLAVPPRGCRFHPRCPFRMDVCTSATPRLAEAERGREVACYLYPGSGPRP